MIGIPLSALQLLTFDAVHPTGDVEKIVDVAQTLERSGYHRIWYAEHHGSLALVPVPPAVAVARVASATSTIRVGSGGVLAVNHAALALAEQFGALTAFFPTRIDLGIGRGPGTFDEATARSLRRGADPATEAEYHENVAEILRLVGEQPTPAEPWQLASSPAGAALAAKLGVPMAFAHHLRPDYTAESVDLYRRDFRPSRWSDSPRLMLGVLTICAETQAKAEALIRPANIMRARLATGEGELAMLDVDAAAAYEYTAEQYTIVESQRQHIALGTPEVVRARLTDLAGTFGADEIILNTPIVDAKDRARSYELVMQGS